MKNILKTVLKVLLVIVVVGAMAVAGVGGAILYKRWESDMKEKNPNLVTPPITGPTQANEEKIEEECFTCLFMGVNGALTDFIMLGQYNPNTKEIALLSIPRDTHVDNSVDGKINSLYMGKYPEKVTKKVEEITGVKIQHYLVFNTKILRQLVDEIGGVTFDVPINMNYDDPAQNLYIHLKKGTQLLTGKKAEQLVRFRHNNDGSGYGNEDIGRIATQQKFIKTMAKEVLSAKNISKLGNLVKIALEGTKTDITMEVVAKYLDDAVTIKTDTIKSGTLPGTAKMGPSPYGYKLAYYYHDEAKTKTIVDKLFNTKNEETSGDTVKANGTLVSEKKIKLELLNASANMSILNDVVEMLNEDEFDVVKIGNYPTTKTENSRIIDYGNGTEDELKSLSEILGISTVEKSEEKSTNVKYSVIIGQNYKIKK